ncbi:NO-inducible flavohemoprotein [Kordiimonas laminariae]|uniref:NO-inducible flavohemoprotein n=1 Tax=Kordiimonas laminariae TaxID=2917717 RepID=UPI001FF64A49|nr:NO-inducible flavohemoprotein [Kordiimonas laminariae]MCK0068102.1 NO-inducible flavohemoprotein [Kordiimonas laminariae]
MLDQNTIDIIKATAPVVAPKADEITSCFYPLMFERYPEVIPYFNQTHQSKGSQPKALANAVVAYALHIENLGALDGAVKQIIQKHCSLGIQPDHYNIVGECLLAAIKAVLGDVASDDIIEAWGKAYGQLAGILIDAEEGLYAAGASKEGGWRGLREFIIKDKVRESDIITSFYLTPKDGGAVPAFEPGQFIAALFNIDGQHVRRNYSLSDAPGKNYLRISVKREEHGLVSNHLHNNLNQGDSIALMPPFGEFTLRKNDKPLVLVTGGVGITPAISMLNTEAATGREIHFIHAALNRNTHAFREHVQNTAAEHTNVKPIFVYNEPTATCAPHAKGFITKEMLEAQIPSDRDVEFYFLGPKPFMQSALKIAKELNIPEGQIHYEFFGPAEDLAA